MVRCPINLHSFLNYHYKSSITHSHLPPTLGNRLPHKSLRKFLLTNAGDSCSGAVDDGGRCAHSTAAVVAG